MPDSGRVDQATHVTSQQASTPNRWRLRSRQHHRTSRGAHPVLSSLLLLRGEAARPAVRLAGRGRFGARAGAPPENSARRPLRDSFDRGVQRRGAPAPVVASDRVPCRGGARRPDRSRRQARGQPGEAPGDGHGTPVVEERVARLEAGEDLGVREAVREQRKAPGARGLDRCDAEELVVRGRDEDVGPAENVPSPAPMREPSCSKLGVLAVTRSSAPSPLTSTAWISQGPGVEACSTG